MFSRAEEKASRIQFWFLGQICMLYEFMKHADLSEAYHCLACLSVC